MGIAEQITNIAKQAKKASRSVATLNTQQKDRILADIKDLLISEKDLLQKENRKDLKKAQEQGLSNAMIDRLTLSDKVIEGMAKGLDDVINLPDPVGEVEKMWKRPNGLQVGKVRIPLGVIGMIYESRPNVTIDAAGLCLKSGNAIILRGGKEALNSNLALADIVQKALTRSGVSVNAVQLIPITDREAVIEMLKMQELIDVIIPRGGEGLIRTVYENSRIPVIAHYKGVCHVFIDQSADPLMAEQITINSKTHRPGVCNALETLLVHSAFAETHLKDLIQALKEKGVIIKGCEKTAKIAGDIEKATEEDWHAEYLDLRLSVRVVENLEEAMDHIDCYGSKHTETIVTSDYANGRKFLSAVDSSVVLINASTRFNDGGQLGLGSEIGISTSKLHSFGPMGLEELTTKKFIVFGEGQIRE
jgi:glutamate-5-semialdehyde dehydrogenase